jgi:hypothetical protein
MFRVADAIGTPLVLKLYRAGIVPNRETWDALQSVNSPFVVRLLEVGENDGRAYEVMEYIRGGTLLDWTEEERLPNDLITEVAQQIASGLKDLHDHQVIHRDLKPANVLLRSRSPLRLALADFGLSRYLPEDAVFSRAGHTLLYTAPETFAGHVSPSRDWWSLGMIVRELATGEPPFRGLPDERVMLDLATRPFDVSNVADERLRLLCMGLLIRDPNLRWGAAEVDQWLGGGSPPVFDGSRHNGSPHLGVLELPTPPRQSAMDKLRRWWRSRARFYGLRRWLSFQVPLILAIIGSIFIVNVVLNGWQQAFRQIVNVASPGDEGVNNFLAAMALSLAGYLVLPTVAGAVAGYVILAASGQNRDRTMNARTRRATKYIPLLEDLTWKDHGQQIPTKFARWFVRCHDNRWPIAQSHWEQMVVQFLNSDAVERNLTPKGAMRRAVTVAAAFMVELPSGARCPFCTQEPTAAGEQV